MTQATPSAEATVQTVDQSISQGTSQGTAQAVNPEAKGILMSETALAHVKALREKTG